MNPSEIREFLRGQESVYDELYKKYRDMTETLKLSNDPELLPITSVLFGMSMKMGRLVAMTRTGIELLDSIVDRTGYDDPDNDPIMSGMIERETVTRAKEIDPISVNHLKREYAAGRISRDEYLQYIDNIVHGMI